MEIKLINYNSSYYNEFVALREKILRKPLGLKFSKEDLLSDQNQFNFVVINDTKIIAGLIIKKTLSNVLKMRQVCVDFSFQHQGIGKKLVSNVENWAIENGYSEIYCHARKNALPFYQKLNYKIEGELFFEIGLEHYRLAKQL